MAFNQLKNIYNIRDAINYLLGKTADNSQAINNLSNSSNLFTDEVVEIDVTLTGTSNQAVFTRTLTSNQIVNMSYEGVVYLDGANNGGINIAQGGGQKFDVDPASAFNLNADIATNPAIGIAPILSYTESGDDIIFQINPNNGLGNVRFAGRLKISTYTRS